MDELGAYVDKPVGNDGFTPLCVAARHGYLALVECLVKELGADVHQADYNGCTPVYTAAHSGHLKMVQCLVKELGTDVTKANVQGGTPFFIAVKQGHLALVKCLVNELGANVNQVLKDINTPLCIAVQNGNKDMVVCLVEELGADVNQAESDGSTPLMQASGRKQEKIGRYLLKNGANAQASFSNIGTAHRHGGRHLQSLASIEQIAYLDARTHYANPGCSGAGLKKCANCKEVFFCSKKCQVTHWPAHKANCKQRVEAKTGNG